MLPLAPPSTLMALPEGSRLWLLALDAPLAPDAAAALEAGLADLLRQWRHKGQAYQAEGALLGGQILAVAEPTLAGQPSGCAIDGMLRRLHRLAEAAGRRVVDPAECVLVRRADAFEAVPKAELADRLAAGTLGPQTPVLNLALYTLGDWAAGKLEAPLAATWIGRKFRLVQPA